MEGLLSTGPTLSSCQGASTLKQSAVIICVCVPEILLGGLIQSDLPSYRKSSIGITYSKKPLKTLIFHPKYLINLIGL